jgi:hypothetical protein
MMVALTIALVLTAVALPRVKEGLKQNVSARTATMVKATFENARAQAIRTGRPFGVRMHRASNAVDPANSFNDPIVTAPQGANFCNRLSYVQMAFEYRGDIEGTSAYFSDAGVRPSIICLQSDTGLLTAIAKGNIQPADRPIVPGSLLSLGELVEPFEVAIAPGRPAAIEIYTALTGEPTDLNGDSVVNASDAGVRVWLRDRAPIVSSLSRFQTGDVLSFKFSTTPIASPMADVPLPGKAVIDFTCSGVGPNVSGFSPRAISDADGFTGTGVYDRPYAVGSTATYEYRDVIVMFNGNGQLDSVYLDQYVAGSGSNTTTESDDYVYVRVPVADPVSLLVADVRNVVLPESMSVFPQRPTGITTTDVPSTYEPTSDVKPNFNNTDNAWLTVSPLSGRVDLSPVASAFQLTDLSARHPELATPTVGSMIQARLFDSRRLARGTVR